MIKNKRFVKYDGNIIIDLKLVKSWMICNGDVDLLIELLNNLYDEDNKWIVEYNGLNIEYQWLRDENERLKDENERLKRLTTHYEIVDINKLAAIIAECKGITVEECLEEMREEYTKEGEKDD